MNRIIFILLTSLIALTGCATGSGSSQQEAVDQSTFESKEEMLFQTGNRAQLIQLYKDSLKSSDSEGVRIKLIETYLAEQDYESAAFHLEALEEKEPDTQVKAKSKKQKLETEAKIVFLKARIHFVRGDLDGAFEQTEKALALQKDYPEAENLMGLIQAELGDFKRARHYFSMARRHYYDDITIKNNLAVLDLIEENYQGAAEKLQPLYTKGVADEKVTANLVVAYAKLGNYKAVEEMLRKQSYSIDEIQSVFIGLKVSDNIAEKQ